MSAGLCRVKTLLCRLSPGRGSLEELPSADPTQQGSIKHLECDCPSTRLYQQESRWWVPQTSASGSPFPTQSQPLHFCLFWDPQDTCNYAPCPCSFQLPKEALVLKPPYDPIHHFCLEPISTIPS